ncbi:DUF6074 family protein [Aquibium sp. LZ166]|uniref:DUF6074 family protein n=1 Tax=Aquibium pacificus TaxID=3153579 RepID=A0ABV3SQZ2_9HYPH
MGSVLPLHERAELISRVARALSRKRRPEAVEYWHRMAKRLLRLQIALGAERKAAEEDLRLLLRAIIRASMPEKS